jgi:hypothetical protein
MKNKKMLWIGLGVVAIVGYFYWMNKKKSSTATDTMNTDTTATDTSADTTTTPTSSSVPSSNFADDEMLNAVGSKQQVKGRFP